MLSSVLKIQSIEELSQPELRIAGLSNQSQQPQEPSRAGSWKMSKLKWLAGVKEIQIKDYQANPSMGGDLHFQKKNEKFLAFTQTEPME